MNRYSLKKVGSIIQIIDSHNFNRVIETFNKNESDEAAEKLDSLNVEFEKFHLKFVAHDF